MTTVHVDDQEVELTLLDEGKPYEIGRWEKRTVRVGRVWEARLDGYVIGYVHYRLVTRERRTPGMRYVSARWESPAWLTSNERGTATAARRRSRKDAVESLLGEWRRR